jgi:EAL domain-containing protein (putative c-di-GMP-specific phosphodiesterase class I)
VCPGGSLSSITSRRFQRIQEPSLSVEALLRWNHPQYGLISPVEFIPLLEELGLIIQVGKWALKTACLQNVAWQKEGFSPLRMAVNGPHSAK